MSEGGMVEGGGEDKVNGIWVLRSVSKWERGGGVPIRTRGQTLWYSI